MNVWAKDVQLGSGCRLIKAYIGGWLGALRVLGSDGTLRRKRLLGLGRLASRCITGAAYFWLWRLRFLLCLFLFTIIIPGSLWTRLVWFERLALGFRSICFAVRFGGTAGLGRIRTLAWLVGNISLTSIFFELFLQIDIDTLRWRILAYGQWWPTNKATHVEFDVFLVIHVPNIVDCVIK
jgi:hypothetical protein